MSYKLKLKEKTEKLKFKTLRNKIVKYELV